MTRLRYTLFAAMAVLTVLLSPEPALAAGSREIAAGTDHTCVLTSEAGLRCWGRGALGKLGDGEEQNRPAPVEVRGLGGEVVSVTAGDFHTCALLVDGRAQCWGLNQIIGQLGDGTMNDSPTPVDVIGLDEPVAELTANHIHTCVRTATAAVLCWGSNTYGELGDGTIGGASSTPLLAAGLGEVEQVVAGGHHTCAVTREQEVRCWGLNLFGQLGAVTTEACEPFDAGSCSAIPMTVAGLPRPVSALAAGAHHTCALVDGAVYCWGRNIDGELGDGTDIDRMSPAPVVGLEERVVAISAKFYHTCALTVADEVWCWGFNAFGQLGDGTTETRRTPVRVEGIGDVRAVTAGISHSCALEVEGRVWCWGTNSNGQLGNGSDLASLRPVEVVGLAIKEPLDATATPTAAGVATATPAATASAGPPPTPPAAREATSTPTTAPSVLPDTGGRSGTEGATATMRGLAVLLAILSLAVVCRTVVLRRTL